jgi:hypothetical protein
LLVASALAAYRSPRISRRYHIRVWPPRFGVILFRIARIQSTGAGMPRYLSQHTLACLTRQGAEELSRRLHAATEVKVSRVLVNMQDGKMLAEFDAPTREDLEKWLTKEKFHFDWLLRIELETDASGTLKPAA